MRCDDCTTCLGCGVRWCRAEITSPGESSGLCADCWLLEAPGTTCPMCPLEVGADALCDCDEPVCVRCHRAHHVEKRASA